jgi:hypothetical protein
VIERSEFAQEFTAMKIPAIAVTASVVAMTAGVAGWGAFANNGEGHAYIETSFSPPTVCCFIH